MTNLFIKEIQLIKDNAQNFSIYPFSLSIIKNFTNMHLTSPVTFIMGDNGSGKSTLLEAIALAYGFNPEGGSRNFNFSTKDTHSSLHSHLRLVKGIKRLQVSFFLRAESFYNVASEYDNLYENELRAGINTAFGSRSLHSQSHGESFLALMQNRLRGNGLYIFDEPEAALSAEGQLKMLSIMKNLVDENSQFIIATHSPIISAFPNATIYEADENEFAVKGYTDTNNYTITKYFLNNTDRMIKELFD